MTSTNYSQAFRDLSTSTTVYIPTRLNKKTDERFVLWKDVLAVFKNAEYILNDNEAVLFMVDGNFDHLVPLRIDYYPGVTLDVVISSERSAAWEPPETPAQLLNGSVSMSAAELPSTTASTAHTNRHDDMSDITSVLLQVSEMSVATARAIEASSDACSPDLVEETRLLLQQSLQRINQFTASSYHQPSVCRMDQLSTTMNNNGPQRAVVKSEIPANNLHQFCSSQMLQTMLENQQQIISLIRVNARQTYELHEYHIPRLFIVLPKPKRRRDKILHPFRKRFKLFFLCECGSDARHGNHQFPRRIHLAKHEGYDLDQVDDFFAKYGSYVLNILKILKIGLAASGIVIPALAGLNLVEGIESFERSFKETSKNVSLLLDEAITALGSKVKGNNRIVKTTPKSGHMDFASLEALEGVDLRRLESFLRTHDLNQTLGNLNRIVTTDGHVKWVCTDHYHERYRIKATRQFNDMVKACGGWCFPPYGMGQVKLVSSTVANAFYESMVKAHGIIALRIELMWEVTQKDLQALVDAVTKAGIGHLNITHFSSMRSGLSTIFDGNQCDPLVQLMCNGQVRALNIMEFEDFFDRVGDTSGIMMTSRLERLRISSTFSPSKRSHVSALVLILKHCPILAELKLSAGDPDNLYSILELVNRQSSLIPNLNDLELKSPEALVNVSFSQRKIVNIRLTMLSDDPFSDRQKLLQLYGLSYLDTGSSTVEESNPRLSIWNLATSIRDTQKRLDSSLGWSSFSITIERCLGDMMGSVKVVLYFSTGSTTPATWTIVKMGVPLAPEMTMFYLELFRDFGWSVYTLETNDGFTDEFAFALDASTRERGSTIEILELNPKSLSLDGLEAMDRVIERSQDLPRLELCLRNLEIKTEVQKAKYLIDRYHENVKSLTFSGISAREWLSDVAEICDTGSGFPKLDSFVLECSDRPEITHEQAQWIASMVSTPTQQSSTSHPGSGACLMELEPNITVPERVPFTWQPRRRVVIPDLQLGHDDWKMVIEALDFSVLRALDLNRTNFSVLELEHLVDCIPSQSNSVDGLNIVLHKSDLESAPADVVHEQLLLLWEKAPWVRVFVSM